MKALRGVGIDREGNLGLSIYTWIINLLEKKENISEPEWENWEEDVGFRRQASFFQEEVVSCAKCPLPID